MNIIKEPEGVIFSVENRDLTVEEKKLLTEFITNQRKKNRITKDKLESNKKRASVKSRLIKV